MRIAGIDPSLNATGLALAGGITMTLKQKAEWGDYRLVNIATDIDCYVIDAGHDFVTMEDLPRNAMGAGITGQVQGVIRERLQSADIPYLLVSAATLKKFATDNGRADKAQMRQAWLERTGIDNPRDDEVDAAWLRTLGQFMAGEIPAERGHWEGAAAKLWPAFKKLGVA
jgi:Holliday junction resolvasome RuvABC endonuclease subunit